MFTFIYLISNIDNSFNNVYVGKTINIKNRKQKYGKQIQFEIIDKVDSLLFEDWRNLERKWIDHYIDLGYNVLNKNKGGNGPEFHSEETKIKKSLSMKGKLKGKPNFKNRGIPKNVGSNFKISLSKLKAVEKLNPHTNEPIETFKSITEANISCGRNPKSSLIGQACDGIVKTAYGYGWKWI